MSYVEIYNERLHDLLQPFKPNARLDPQVPPHTPCMLSYNCLHPGSGLPPWETPVMIAEKRKLIFLSQIAATFWSWSRQV